MIESKMIFFVTCDGCGRIDKQLYSNAQDCKKWQPRRGWWFSDTGWIYEETTFCPTCWLDRMLAGDL
jgi:hypothetical protein